MKKILTVFLTAVFAAGAALQLRAAEVAGAAPASVKIGQPAPQIKEKILKGGLKALENWDDLKGRAVVLEFWDIDCPPCVGNIPHLNGLVEKFKDRPVVFISLSKNSEGEIQEFIKTHEMKGNIAAEARGAFKSFKVNSIPHTVLIDTASVVRSFTYPSEVTDKTIEDLLAGREIAGLDYSSEESPGVAADAKSYFSISPSSGGLSLSYSDSKYRADGMTLSYAIEVAMRGVHGVDYKDVPASLLDGKYDISAGVTLTSGDDSARLRALVIAGLNGAFPFHMAEAGRVRKVYLLKKTGEARPGLVAASGMGGSRQGRHSKDKATLAATGINMNELCRELENWLATPVLDETGAGDAQYDLALLAAPVNYGTVNAALKEKLGLELAEASREVEIIEVTGIKRTETGK